MEELLKGMLLQILDFSNMLPTDFYDTVNASLSSYGAVLTAVNNVMKGTIFAIGASMLSLFMLMDMIAVINRYSSDGGITGTRIPINMMIRFGIFTFLYCNLGKVMLGLQEIAVNIATGIGIEELNIDTSALNTITDIFADMNMLEQVGAFVMILIIFCITQVLFLIIQTTAFFRIFELFIVYMFAPIPLSTLASQEFRSVAINYLKNFLSICLQGAIILASFKLYNMIIVAKIQTLAAINFSSFTSWDVFMQILVPITGYLCVLAIAVSSSGRISKSIVNAF